ncbi:MAG: hypothetical protein LH614_13560 [Pyrinomonadaceae bacterium]|nr:hypothetical protein [Pyrinomonadaceae bacterium]
MNIREEIVNKIRQIPESRLPELYKVVEELVEKKPKEGLLKRLQKIKIDGPPDFAENFDLYANGEKSLDDFYQSRDEK